MELIVSNLPVDTNEEEFWTLFQVYGTVENVEIIRDEETNVSRGFGFILMDNEEEASKAIAALHKSKYKGCVLRVKESFNAEDDMKDKYCRKQLRRKDRKNEDLFLFEDSK